MIILALITAIIATVTALADGQAWRLRYRRHYVNGVAYGIVPRNAQHKA